MLTAPVSVLVRSAADLYAVTAVVSCGSGVPSTRLPIGAKGSSKTLTTVALAEPPHDPDRLIAGTEDVMRNQRRDERHLPGFEAALFPVDNDFGGSLDHQHGFLGTVSVHAEVVAGIDLEVDNRAGACTGRAEAIGKLKRAPPRSSVSDQASNLCPFAVSLEARVDPRAPIA